MIHIFQKGSGSRTFILLHGTGGDEKDLIPIAHYLDNTASILGIRGNINEDGMNRYFKRYGIGQYDLVNLKEETTKLKQFIYDAIESYQLKDTKLYILGFSNGANIALSMLRYDLDYDFGFILLSPALIDPKTAYPDLSNTRIFISTSNNDPYLPSQDLSILNNQLVQSFAQLTIYQHPYGHQITKEVLDSIKDWMDKT